MDVKRDPAILKKKRQRQIALLVLAGIVVVGISVAVNRLQPAAPSVPAGTLWYGTVKRGPMVREVRGAGTLVPEAISWIAARATGRVETIVLQPGAEVKPGTVIVLLSNPDLQQTVKNAELDWRTAQAQLESQKANLATTRISQEIQVSNAKSEISVSQSRLDANKKLLELGIVSELQVKTDQAALDRSRNALELAEKQLKSAIDNEKAQLSPGEANVSQKRAEFDRLAQQLDDLRVKSTMHGRLQLINVEVGRQVALGSDVARVSDPTRLKAEIRISETQTRDLAIGQRADIDTRNGHIPGRVSRIDPASTNGTVGVDVTLEGPLPAGARPDASVDGTIELERLVNVLYVESPAFGQENTVVQLYKVYPDGTGAARSPVKLGRRSVMYVEVLEGLAEGESVVLSDMTQYDSFDRIKCDGLCKTTK
jgi:HlyD family secretion protein